MRPPLHPWPSAPLRLAASLYGGLIRLRNRHYDRPGSSSRVEVPVLSVGNLTLGGTGKTPIVAWIARRLSDSGVRPAIVSRGYRGKAGRGPLLASSGDGPTCDAALCGDEPFLLASTLPGVMVVVGSDRVAGALLAHSRGADVIVLDDGFQHRRLDRDLDIVLLDAGDPFGGGRLLPAGRLREPLGGLRRAHAVLITRARRQERFAEIERVVRRHNRSVPILTAGHRGVGFVDARGAPCERPSRAVAFCGIGSPEGFRADLEACGVELLDFRRWPDHHAYTPRELSDLAGLAAGHASALVTTEKDLARLSGRWPGPDPPLALRIEAEIHDPRSLLDLIHRALP